VSTLWRYLGRRFAVTLLGSFVILALVVLVVDMLLNLDEILEAQRSLAGAARFIGLRSAALFLPYLIPAAAFAAAFLTVGLAARANEVVAMKAGGVAPLRALLPVFVIAIGLSGVALVVNETVSVRAAAALSAQAGSQGGDISLRSGTIWYHTGRFIYNIRDPDPDQESVRDIRIFERNEDGRLVRLVQAARARRLAPKLWAFEDATVRLFDPEEPAAPPRITRAARLELELEQDRSPRLVQAELSTLPVWTLAGYVHSVLESGGDARRARALLHERLTGPLMVLVFTLLAVPLGLRVEQTRTLALPALEGVVLLFLFLSFREYGAALVPNGSTAQALVPWAVVALFGSYGALRLARVPQ